ncbi:unnamed protein product [Effrenium voratum]|uniref:Uncharacterized protein n=1 Tax=Effrenium voratum TaxID=2562239 RepID=A0AA36MJF1_9DINO|nr:unnamed protein product [Effrenium voratum]
MKFGGYSGFTWLNDFHSFNFDTSTWQDMRTAESGSALLQRGTKAYMSTDRAKEVEDAVEADFVTQYRDDYAAALMAASPGSETRVPLILVDDQATLKSVIDALKVQELFYVGEKCRDAPYADLDEDIFLDVALGRIVARNLASASLLVSRIGNYDYVRDAASEGRFGMGGTLKSSADSIRPALTNVGFSVDMVDEHELAQLQKLQVSAFIHVDHAGAGGMGHSFKYNTKVLLSPSVVSSGGCSTSGFDKLSDPMDSVVLTLLHYGAVAFLGGPRNAITASGLVHKTAEYVMMNIALMGDPAFKLFIPSAAAAAGWKRSLLLWGPWSHATEKMWHGSKLHDVEFPYLYARFTTTADVVGFKASEVPLPLGWTGPDRGRGYPGSAGTSLHEDRHADGSKTLMWRACVTGQLADQTYEMILGGSAKPTPHDLCQKGCVEHEPALWFSSYDDLVNNTGSGGHLQGAMQPGADASKRDGEAT